MLFALILFMNNYSAEKATSFAFTMDFLDCKKEQFV